MELPNTVSPTGHVIRRRKKRSSGGPVTGAPGSALTGLNRNSIRVVELFRRSMGYGFTISGQKPCLLRCIIDGSPAFYAGLRPGHCLVGVNGRDVSHLAHDDVVRIIGNCTGLLKLHVAESYFSESSDDDAFKESHQRQRYAHRPRGSSKTSLTSKKPHHHHVSLANGPESAPNDISTIRSISSTGEESLPPPRLDPSAWDPVLPSTSRTAPRPPLPFKNPELHTGHNPKRGQPEKVSSSEARSNPRMEVARLFDSLDELHTHGTGSQVPVGHRKSGIGRTKATTSMSDRFGTQSSSGSSSRPSTSTSSELRKMSGSEECSSASSVSPGAYQVVVGYVGSVELPEIQPKKRLDALSACVRRLRLERRFRSIVLLRIQSNGISIFGSGQNVQIGPPLSFYSSNIISFCGASSDDRRFFGLVTCTGPNKNSSCHIFMVEPKLLNHTQHVRRAEDFGFKCTHLPGPRNGQVLGLQECHEFPATADPILSSIVQLHQPDNEPGMSDITSQIDPPTSSHQRSPSDVSNRLESTTTSSNSDSGIGFRDDSDRLSAKIYDIVGDGDKALLEIRNLRKSPVPKRRVPPSSSHEHPCSSTNNPVPTALQFSKVSPRSIMDPDHHTNIASMKKSFHARGALSPSHLYQPDDEFVTDANSMNEILGKTATKVKPPVPRRLSRDALRDRLSLNPVPRPRTSRPVRPPPEPESPPRPIEVAVVITPPRNSNNSREKRTSMELMSPISPSRYEARTRLANRISNNGYHGNMAGQSPPLPLPRHVSLSRHGTRSLDNLCSPEILNEAPTLPGGPGSSLLGLECKGTIGSSTPALNQDSGKIVGDDFWEFKVPQAPKPKMEINRVETWSESLEKLLGDTSGLEVFTEFLEREFSAENIHFYSACLGFKESFPDLTHSQRISITSTIFQRYLQNGATDPINVDYQARSQVEKALSVPTLEMFDLPLSQVFNLLKFDCYPRFLRSDLYRDYASGIFPLSMSVGEPSDSDADSVKSSGKIQGEGRRRSLLPWNIKGRSKNKNRNKSEFALNSNMSFIQRAAESADGSDQEEAFRRQSFKLCRVILPDNSTTVLPCKPGESLSTVVQRLLEKREFNYSAFEVVTVSNGKPLDLNMEVSEITAREIKVEPRAFIGIELPLGWRVGVRANPVRKIAEVLKPILAQHSLKLDAVVVHDIDTNELVDIKWPMGRVDGHNLNVRTKAIDSVVEASNQIQEFQSCDDQEPQFLEDDQASAKTSSSHASSVFRGFLRRSSKKYKKEKVKSQPTSRPTSKTITEVPNQPNRSAELAGETSNVSLSSQSSTGLESSKSMNESNGNCSATSRTSKTADEENSNSIRPQPTARKSVFSSNQSGNPVSPLGLISELNSAEQSRNRKPIYITQGVEQGKR